MKYFAIQSAISSGTALLQIFKGLASMKIETKTLGQINAAEQRISEMLDALVGAQEDLIRLHLENRELRAQLKAMSGNSRQAGDMQPHDPPGDRAKDGRVSAGIPRHTRPGNSRADS
jgi:hypothetical protein